MLIFLENSRWKKNKIKVMGMKEIKDREKDWPGSSHWKQAPEYQ